MVIIVHKNNKVVTIERGDVNEMIEPDANIARQLFVMAKKYPEDWLLWCDAVCKDQLNVEALPELFHHKRMMHSFGEPGFLTPNIGFVENSPFIKINTEVQYPTWQMSTQVGGIHSSVLNAIEPQMTKDINFSYFLNSLAKLLMPLGLFCYHNPALLKKPIGNPEAKATAKTLFRFVKQHYKTRWLFFFFINLWVYKKQFHIVALLSALFYKKRILQPKVLEAIPLQSSKPFHAPASIDIVLPTIGRINYVKAVINDLAKQTRLPEKVIIIEQNPDAGSVSELKTELEKNWPFEIKHLFTHKAGACHARNLGLKEVTADWVFLADDDIKLESTFFSELEEKIKKTAGKAITISCLQKHEKEYVARPLQWTTFGSGCSIVETKSLNKILFDETLEHGYGEDADYGMQLRNKGVDIIYVPKPSILHLKAPIGGFRTKPVLPWHQETIAPKPSPTIMRFHLKHRTQEQILGYKTGLFLMYYQKQAIINPLKYLKRFKEQWNKSIFWAKKLAVSNETNQLNQ